MAEVELIMPKMGESIFEATILTWLKKPGDKIEQDESVLEVATDKVDTEVPSTYAGVLKEILAKTGEVVQVGKPIAIITTEAGAAKTASPSAAPVKSHDVAETLRREEPVAVHTNGTSHASHAVDYKSSSRFYSPLVKNIAKEENITVAELETISGSGAEGRVTKKDIMDYVQHRKLGSTIQAVQHAVKTTSASTVSAAPKVPASISAGDEIIEMDRMRKMIAERMVDSKRIAPHV